MRRAATDLPIDSDLTAPQKPTIEATWPPGTQPSNILLAMATLAMRTAKPVNRQVQPAQETQPLTIVGTPVEIDRNGQARTAFAMIEPKRRHQSVANANHGPADANAATDPLEEFNRSRTALRLLAQFNKQSSFAGACLAFVNELARLTGANRVALGLIMDGAAVVRTVSGSTRTENKTALLRDLAMAMNEAIDQTCTIVYPSPPGNSAKVTLNHGRFTIRHSSPTLCTIPIAMSDEQGRALIGAISLEFGNARDFDKRAIRFTEHISTLIGRSLDSRRQLDTPVTGRLARAFSGRTRKQLAPRSQTRKLVATAAAALILIVLLVPVPYRVSADAWIEGARQRVLAAPVDGFINKVYARPGELVKAGEPLVDLDDRELAIQASKWASEIQQIQKQYGNALAAESQSAISIEKARLSQAQAELADVNSKLQRLRMTAPFDGVVLDGDLSQSLGAPVQRGQTLMSLAPANQFRVIVNVQEKDIPRVTLGSQGELMLSAISDRSFGITVNRISPVAVAAGDSNIFKVQADVTTDQIDIRPGLKGVAKIDSGRRSLLASATAGFRHWLRITLWKWQF